MSHANTLRDWVRRAPQHGAVERIEAYFAGHGYDPHRHDTYAIGQTLAGVQSFRYRRSQRHSLPGGCLVLHPDEPARRRGRQPGRVPLPDALRRAGADQQALGGGRCRSCAGACPTTRA